MTKSDFDVLVLSAEKKIIAEDDKFIALKLWEYTHDETKSIYRTFLKNVHYMIGNYVIRSDNMTRVHPDNHFIEKECRDIEKKMLSWLYYLDKDRRINGEQAKSLLISIGMMGNKELAQPISPSKTSKYIQEEIIKESI